MHKLSLRDFTSNSLLNNFNVSQDNQFTIVPFFPLLYYTWNMMRNIHGSATSLVYVVESDIC